MVKWISPHAIQLSAFETTAILEGERSSRANAFDWLGHLHSGPTPRGLGASAALQASTRNATRAERPDVLIVYEAMRSNYLNFSTSQPIVV